MPGRNYRLALVTGALAWAVTLAASRPTGSLFSRRLSGGSFLPGLQDACSPPGFSWWSPCAADLPGVSPNRHPEFYLLLAVCTLAMMMLVCSGASADDLYCSGAVQLLPVHAGCPAPGRDGIWAGLKYFLVGATASAVMLFGLALLYGATGTAYHLDCWLTLSGPPGTSGISCASGCY